MAPKRTKPPVLTSVYSGRVTAWDAVVSLDGSNVRSVTLNVSLLEPIKSRSSATVIIIEQRTNAESKCHLPEQTSIAITAISKDKVHALAVVTNAEMTALLMLATGNRLKSCLLACPEPYRGRAIINALRVGTCEPEDLG